MRKFTKIEIRILVAVLAVAAVFAAGCLLRLRILKANLIPVCERYFQLENSLVFPEEYLNSGIPEEAAAEKSEAARRIAGEIFASAVISDEIKKTDNKIEMQKNREYFAVEKTTSIKSASVSPRGFDKAVLTVTALQSGLEYEFRSGIMKPSPYGGELTYVFTFIKEHGAWLIYSCGYGTY